MYTVFYVSYLYNINLLVVPDQRLARGVHQGGPMLTNLVLEEGQGNHSLQSSLAKPHPLHICWTFLQGNLDRNEVPRQPKSKRLEVDCTCYCLFVCLCIALTRLSNYLFLTQTCLSGSSSPRIRSLSRPLPPSHHHSGPIPSVRNVTRETTALQ